MVTIGDSFSIVATLAGVALTLWSFMLCCALLFPSKVEESRGYVSLSLGKTIGSGVVAFLLGLVGMVVLQAANPFAKLAGMLIVGAYLGCVMVGAAGIAKLAADRLRTLTEQRESPFHAFSKASLYLVMAGMLPILGWFILAPLVMVIGGGAGFRSAISKQAVAEVA